MNDSTTMKNPSEPGDDPRTQSVDGESSKLGMKRPKKSSELTHVRTKKIALLATRGEKIAKG